MTTVSATVVGSPPIRRRSRHAAAFWTYFVAAVLLAVVFVAPLVWSVLRSFQPAVLASAAPQAGDFTHFTFANYTGVFAGDGIAINLLNSLIVALGTVLITTVVAALAGYGFARFRFRGSGLVFGLLLLALMIPFQAVLTPLFIELTDLNLTNNLMGLMLVYATFNLPFGVFVMRNTFTGIPRELTESAAIDGAGSMRTLVSVLRPLITPGLATTAVYAFLYSWTEFLQALTFLASNNKLTLPVKLFDISSGTYGAINNGYLSAGIVIAMVPCIVLYVALQRYYVQGLMSGALKG